MKIYRRSYYYKPRKAIQVPRKAIQVPQKGIQAPQKGNSSKAKCNSRASEFDSSTANTDSSMAKVFNILFFRATLQGYLYRQDIGRPNFKLPNFFYL